MKKYGKNTFPGNLAFVLFLSTCLLLLLDNCRYTEDTEDNLVESSLEPTGVDESAPTDVNRLLKAYPDFLVSADGNELVWQDGTRMPFDDGIDDKDYEMLLNKPGLRDQFRWDYPKGRIYSTPEQNRDPGRIRYEPFFLKMYGASPEEVQRNLVPVSWLPSTVNKTLMVTSVNGVNQRLQAVSGELDKMPHLHRYVDDPAGTFNWRRIKDTERLSLHSFGIAVDINVEYSNYWKWDDPGGERLHLDYVNRIPLEIVEIFEKHGFIWGGKWYHYDTMHFEYRPELLIDVLED